jgi:hypothetical protein
MCSISTDALQRVIMRQSIHGFAVRQQRWTGRPVPELDKREKRRHSPAASSSLTISPEQDLSAVRSADMSRECARAP